MVAASRESRGTKRRSSARQVVLLLSRPVAIGAFAITAVINLGGETLARLLFSFQKRDMNALRTRWQGMRVVIFDDISMATWL